MSQLPQFAETARLSSDHQEMSAGCSRDPQLCESCSAQTAQLSTRWQPSSRAHVSKMDIDFDVDELLQQLEGQPCDASAGIGWDSAIEYGAPEYIAAMPHLETSAVISAPSKEPWPVPLPYDLFPAAFAAGDGQGVIGTPAPAAPMAAAASPAAAQSTATTRSSGTAPRTAQRRVPRKRSREGRRAKRPSGASTGAERRCVATAQNTLHSAATDAVRAA